MISPLTGKEMVLRCRPITLDYKGRSYTINWYHYFCELSNTELTTTELDEMNLQELWDQYDEDLLNFKN